MIIRSARSVLLVVIPILVSTITPLQSFTFVNVQKSGCRRTTTTTRSLPELQAQQERYHHHRQQQQQQQQRGQRPGSNEDDDYNHGLVVNRRSAMMKAIIAGQFSVVPVVLSSKAAMENVPQNIFKAGQSLTVEEAESRLQEGRKSIQYLLDHYDEICEGGGDNVRRYLGTVGMTSGLFGISKVMKALEDKADDFVEYTEVSNEVLKSIQQADGSAYMAIFVTTSTSQTPPSKYFGDAKIEIKRCIKALDELATLIDVKI